MESMIVLRRYNDMPNIIQTRSSYYGGMNNENLCHNGLNSSPTHRNDTQYKLNQDLTIFIWAGALEVMALQWRHNERDVVSNHQLRHCLLNGLFRRRSKKTSNVGDRWISLTKGPVTRKMFSFDDDIMVWSVAAILVQGDMAWSETVVAPVL